ncbi:MAG: ROK family protein [Phycisphaerae bacterium]|nr:ROK family protein [Phycisphaerae bacterium]
MTPVYVGIDLGGTNMSVGVTDARGKLLGQAKRKTKAQLGRDGVIARMVGGVQRACNDANVSIDDVAAIGVGAPGPIDVNAGVVIKSGNLGWEHVPLRDLLAAALNRPVALDNDVNVAAYGEATIGVARGREHLLAVWVGTGIGGALVMHRAIFHGSFFTAGELGYTIVIPEGGPGARTLEQHSSRTAMAAVIRQLLPSFPDSAFHGLLKERDSSGPADPVASSVIAEAYAARDELALRVVHHAADVLGLAIANWITVLSLDTVVLGGGVTEALGRPFLERVRRTFDRSVFPAQCRQCEICLSDLGDLAGVFGAAMLARGCVVPGSDGVNS